MIMGLEHSLSPLCALYCMLSSVSFHRSDAFSPSSTAILPTSLPYQNGADPFTQALDWTSSSLDRQQTNSDTFETWGKMRLGLGDGPGSNDEGVFWVGGGYLYEAHSGRELALFEGFDIGKGVRFSDNHIRQISRKIFWFRDPITGEIMEEFEGKEVKPIVYDSQMIDYFRADDGSITYSVEASLRNLKGELPKMKITSQMVGPRQMMIQVPVFIDVEIPGRGKYQAWEFYDYSVDPSFPADRPPTASWCRQGSVPPFNMDSKAVLRFSGYRCDRFEDLPDRMKEEVVRNHPHFTSPPKDEKEVEGVLGQFDDR